MSASYFAITLWEDDEEFLVQVTGFMTYRVSVDGDEVHITAPGLDKTVVLTEGLQIEGDPERLAIVLVALLEGGAEL